MRPFLPSNSLHQKGGFSERGHNRRAAQCFATLTFHQSVKRGNIDLGQVLCCSRQLGVSVLPRDRQHVLTALAELLGECINGGQGRIAVITGPAACGKTALTDALMEHAAALDVTCLSAVCSLSEKSLPLSVAGQIYHNLTLVNTDSAESARIQDEMAAATRMAAAAQMLDQPPSANGWLRIAHGFWLPLLRVAQRRPLLIIVDNLDHADPPSIQLLFYLVRRLRTAGIMVVFTATEQPGVNSLLDIDLPWHSYARRFTLGPLSRETVADMVGQALGERVGQRLGARCHELSGGSFILVNALIADSRAALATGMEPAEPVVGDHFSRAVVALLHRNGPAVRQVARAIAILADNACTERVATLLDMDANLVERAMDTLVATGLLDDTAPGATRFRHAAARTAVFQELYSQERNDLHVRAAHLLYGEGMAATAIAAHLIEAAYAKPGWAADTLREAGEQAMLSDQLELSVQCLRLAAQTSDDTLVTEQLARAEWLLNPSTAARLVSSLATAAQEDNLEPRNMHKLVRYLLWHGNMDEAVDALKRLTASAEELDEEDAAELEITQQWLRSSYPAMLTHVRLASVPVAGTTPAAASLHMQAATALITVLKEGPKEEVLRRAEEVLRSSHLDSTEVDAVESALFTLIYAERTDLATPWADHLYEMATRRRSPTWRALITAFQAEIALRQGDLLKAEEYADKALRILPPRAWGVWIGILVTPLLHATTEMDKHEVTMRHLRQRVPDAIFQTRYGLHYLNARARYYLATNHVHVALRDFLLCGRLMREWGLDTPALVPWRSGAAEAYLKLGEPERARKLIQEQVGLPGGESPRVRGNTLRVMAATSEPADRPELLSEAVKLLQESGDRLELAYALTDLTHAFDRLGDSARARLTGNMADSVASGCHAVRLRRSIPFGPDPGTLVADEIGRSARALSDAEQRVASLAAAGHTNREIAGKLFITVSTVEQHLTRIYRKLGVNGRSDLPMLFQPGGPPPVGIQTRPLPARGSAVENGAQGAGQFAAPARVARAPGNVEVRPDQRRA
ncbi:helix-turn-helix transcriptional regulator [Spongiactinospora gelatinilytica]|uniref:Helix-turn-helix transcriptional regulator n=1 Tax=Spongiactinospora gelatinilytica TaxID=2666298 RepID=A0A2W2GLX8_9ACTN|nr:helix-turn-helix transcriptional regulator [Spongiactinospora gelatinilytica]